MKVSKLSDYTRGWIIGDFEPSILKTKDFEVAVFNHSKGESRQMTLLHIIIKKQ